MIISILRAREAESQADRVRRTLSLSTLGLTVITHFLKTTLVEETTCEIIKTTSFPQTAKAPSVTYDQSGSNGGKVATSSRRESHIHKLLSRMFYGPFRPT